MQVPSIFSCHLVRTFAASAALLGACTLAAAQSGTQVVRLIVPFAAGSYTDNVARIIAPGLGRQLGSTVIIENKAGANGVIGADYVAKSPPDGLTFLVGGASVNTVNPGVYKALPYDPVKDLLPVVRFGLLPFLLVTHPNVPVNSTSELIAYAKKNPGKLAYGTPNSSTLVGMETFKRTAGIDILSVQYKSSPQAMADLVGNHVQVLIADFATAMPQVRAGKARLLGVTMKERSPLLPEAVPMAESVKDFDLSAWTGLLAPGATQPAAVKRMADALLATLAAKDTQEHLAGIGFDVKPMGPEVFGPYVRSELQTWSRLIKDAGIKPE
ncbi:MAG: transporter substrate-binding protein [Polaromonas sp.]|jgi:tripartite-type tricarboxylate transporter receptor subunit TctC|nr:transporter substrate-binding protein [Polaromonas sp.]